MFKPTAYIAYCCILLLVSCAHPVGKWRRAGLIPKKYSHTIKIGGQQKDSLQILYTGCGGLVIKKGNDAIITDPFYTGHGLLKVGLGKIGINVKNDERVLDSIRKYISPSSIKTALIAHSHYDHLEDLPYLMEKNKLNDSLKIIGSSSTYCTIDKFMRPGYSYLNADTFCYRQNPPNTFDRYWIPVSKYMRILTIEAAHAPHIGRYISFMGGSTCGQGIKNFSSSESRSCGMQWKTGTTFSFLIDILDDSGTITFRMFVQSSSCSAPYGFPPKALLDQKKVDLAFIGVASAQNIDCYPHDLLQQLGKPRLMLIHWENFFGNMYKKRGLKSVAGTSATRFMKELKKRYGAKRYNELPANVTMPKPLTWIKVNY